MIALLIQYFKNGCAVVAKNRTTLLCRINVVIFQLMMNTPMATPTITELKKLTLPMYSGARNNDTAPKLLIKLPAIVANNIYQNTKNIW
jgi:hypothetical protein